MITTAMLMLLAVAPANGDEQSVPVGMPGRIEQLLLPGSLLEAQPLTDRQTPVVARIVSAWPHGDAHRYDIEYYGLEPGSYDLRDYLQRVDGTPLTGVEPIPVTVVSSLPPGQVLPNTPNSAGRFALGGYRMLLVTGGVLWGAGLLAILFAGRRRKAKRQAVQLREATLDERLSAALRAAADGSLPEHDRGELERMVLAHWRKRLELEDLDAAEAMAVMRKDEQARAVLEQLERWLHDPGAQCPPDFLRLTEPDHAAGQHAAGQPEQT